MDSEGALWTLILGPIMAFVVGAFFWVAFQIHEVTKSRVDGEMQRAANATGDALGSSYQLYQLGSALETVFALAVLFGALYAFGKSRT